MRRCSAALFALGLFLGPRDGMAQERPRGVPRFPIENGPLALAGPARPGAYLADVGRKAAILGDETGAFEVWTWPLKLVRDLTLAFRIPDYDAPIPAASVARSVVVRPEGATIVYSHATFTVRQHVFVPLEEPGALVLLDVESVRPLDVLVRLHADFDLAWPGSFGGGDITWQDDDRRFLLSQGGVRLYNGMVGSPFAVSGTTHPAHDAPTTASQLLLSFDAAAAAGAYIPIVIAGGAAPHDSVAAVYDRLLANAPRYWNEKVRHYRRVRQQLLTLDSPDGRLDHALEWAKVNLEQQLACNPDLGCGLVAGFGRAGAGNYRPGSGWYFGGDAAINSFAMDGLGQFDLVRQGLAFLAAYQREDGRIPHQISHAARRLPWFTDYPYVWLHGDATPFWVLACYEYWKATDDDAFLRRHWPKLVRAFRWSAAADTDGDGLMEATEASLGFHPAAGAGAIGVGGPGEELHTDIYLAGVWTAALEGVLEMARAADDAAVAREAGALFEKASRALDERFWLEGAGVYAFGLPRGGEAAQGGIKAAGSAVRLDDALTIWPTTAMSFRLLNPVRATRMLREIGSSAITTDWGARMLSQHHSLYEPLDNGAVWPLVAGFVSLAHFRYHRTWAGYDLVRDVARTTYDFARGRNPELLSGAFYQTLDTAVPHGFSATSMLVHPLVRGLLGLEADAPNHAVAIEPHLPADWDSMSVENFRVGSDRLALRVQRDAELYSVTIRRTAPERTEGRAGELAVRLSPALPLGARVERIAVNGRDVPVQVEESLHDVHPIVEFELEDEALVEIELRGGVEVVPPVERLTLGEGSAGLRILDFRREARDYLLVVEGLAGRSYPLELRTASPIRAVQGAELAEQEADRATLRIPFAAGKGYTRMEVRFRG